MIDILHRHPDGAHVAFRALARPAEGTIIHADMCVLLDGTTPVNGEPIICGTCNEQVDPKDLHPEGGFA